MSTGCFRSSQVALVLTLLTLSACVGTSSAPTGKPPATPNSSPSNVPMPQEEDKVPKEDAPKEDAKEDSKDPNPKDSEKGNPSKGSRSSRIRRLFEGKTQDEIVKSGAEILAAAFKNRPSNGSVKPVDPSEKKQIEVEFEEFDLRFISSQGTQYDSRVVELKHLPRGAALITDSGALAEVGIRNVIHAASGSAGGAKDEAVGKLIIPSLEGVRLSVENSMILANRFKTKSVAIPLVGGKIFLSRLGITAEVLADTVVRAALSKRGNVKIVFIDFDDSNFKALSESLEKEKSALPAADLDSVRVVQGNILSFELHQCDSIVNAANTEVEFGGGISGVIGKGTKIPAALDQFAAGKVQLFNQILAETYFAHGEKTRPAASGDTSMPLYPDAYEADWVVQVTSSGAPSVEKTEVKEVVAQSQVVDQGSNGDAASSVQTSSQARKAPASQPVKATRGPLTSRRTPKKTTSRTTAPVKAAETSSRPANPTRQSSSGTKPPQATPSRAAKAPAAKATETSDRAKAREKWAKKSL